MKVVDPNDTTHVIDIIPRYYGFVDAVLTLSSLADNVDEAVAYTSVLTNGVLAITFDYDFTERNKYTVKLIEIDEVVWRGQIFATDQATQDFDITKTYFTYG
jgi:hypothetical protein